VSFQICELADKQTDIQTNRSQYSATLPEAKQIFNFTASDGLTQIAEMIQEMCL